MDELFAFNEKNGSPIPEREYKIAKKTVDLFNLYSLVVERGGLQEAIAKGRFTEILKKLEIPSRFNSAAYNLRKLYMRYLYAFECEKKGFSQPSEMEEIFRRK